MRTDLKLNYGKLREIRGEISEYRQSLERVDNGLENLKRFLAGQESEAVDKLNKKLSDVTINIRDKIETLQLLEETLEDYVDDMERLVKAEGGGITRVDTWDISFNLSQIQTAVRESFRPMSSTVRGMPHFSLIEDEEEKEKKKKRERNYNRLERFRSSDIMSLKRRVDRHLEDLQDIYKNYLKPYEKLDDTYRSRLNKIYSSHTSAGDKWANFWDGFARVADSFVTAFAIAAVTAFIAAITPAWLAVAGVVLLGVGVAVMANIPEESVPDWLKPVKKGADGIEDKAVKMLKEGPASVVEDIGQGLMDEIQTLEGIASVAGGTVGTLAGGYAGSRVNSALKVKKSRNIGGDRYSNATFATKDKLVTHFEKHGNEFRGIFNSVDEYLQGARDVMNYGHKVEYSYKGETRVGFVQFFKNSSKGKAKFAFVGTNKEGHITTFHTESGKTFWKLLNGENIPIINPK